MRALVWSAGLHLLVLGLLAPQWASRAQGVAPVQVLQGRLLAVATESPALVLVEKAVAISAQRAPASIATRQPQAAVPPAPTFAFSASAQASEAGGVPALRDSTGPATVALATEVRDNGPDAAGLRQFRLALAGEARRYKRYPETARRSGLAGTAEVRVAVEAVGSERLTELARSSGHAVLDVVALEMLRQAAARTSLPESLRGQRFAVLMPVVFEVED